MGDDDAPLTPVESQELSDLRTEVADTRGANFAGHWKDSYYHSETKQARYASLLEREEIAKDVPAVSRQEPVERDPTEDLPSGEVIVSNFKAIDANLAAEVALRGADSAVRFGQETALAIFDDLGPAGAQNLSAKLDNLPGPVQGAIYGELTNAYIPEARTPTHDEVEKFYNTEAGMILKNEWGTDTPARLSRCLARIHRLEADLDDASFDQWQRFWRFTLTPAQRAAALRHMSK